MMNLRMKFNKFGSILLYNDLFKSKCHIPMSQSPVCGSGGGVKSFSCQTQLLS